MIPAANIRGNGSDVIFVQGLTGTLTEVVVTGVSLGPIAVLSNNGVLLIFDAKTITPYEAPLVSVPPIQDMVSTVLVPHKMPLVDAVIAGHVADWITSAVQVQPLIVTLTAVEVLAGILVLPIYTELVALKDIEVPFMVTEALPMITPLVSTKDISCAGAPSEGEPAPSITMTSNSSARDS
jgi:ribose/xylose/arabinose/galactoside ABC-type transport system permease subunit